MRLNSLPFVGLLNACASVVALEEQPGMFMTDHLKWL
jgi:hypothetical protein